MYFEKDVGNGLRKFFRFEKGGPGLVLKSHGFVGRAKTKGMNPVQQQLTTEGPLIHDGSQCVLSTANDARNSTLTGSTLAGPSGSGQFLAVTISTSRVVSLCSTTFQNLSSGTQFYGILQNKPRGGEAADVGIFGLTKAVAGSSAITGGGALQTSSTSAGTLVPWAQGNGRPCAMAVESAGTVGQVFLVFVGGQQVLSPLTT